MTPKYFNKGDMGEHPKIILEDDEETHWELTKEANDKIKRGLEDIKQGRITSLEDIKKEKD